MPRHASVATVIEKNRIASAVAFVALLEVYVKDNIGTVVETLRYARNSENISFQGHEYLAGNFSVEMESTTGETPQVRLSVVDITKAVQSKIEQYSGGIGFEIRVMIVNTGNMTQPAEIDETFFVLGASTKNYNVDFTLGSRNPTLIRFPRRLQLRDRCSWRYKGPECGYSGPLPSCDYSLNGQNGCQAHQNTLRFGGFPGLRPRNAQ